MRLSACVVRKRVEDSEARRPESKCEPSGGRWLLLYQLKTALEKRLDLTLFPWLRFQSNQETHRDHLDTAFHSLCDARKVVRVTW